MLSKMSINLKQFKQISIPPVNRVVFYWRKVMYQNIRNTNTVQVLSNIQKSHLNDRKSKVYESLKFTFRYVDGLLCVPYKVAQDYMKHQLKRKVLRIQTSGETICRKTRKQFAIIKDQLYVNVNWLLDMVEFGLVKV